VNFSEMESLPDNFIEFIKFKYSEYPFPLYQTNDKIVLYDRYINYDDSYFYVITDIAKEKVKREILDLFNMNKMELLSCYRHVSRLDIIINSLYKIILCKDYQEVMLEPLKYLLGYVSECK
jgi:hypothetical protein